MMTVEVGLFAHKKRQLFRFVGWFYFINSIALMIVGSPYLQRILYSVRLYSPATLQFVFLKKSFLLFFSMVNYLIYMQILAFLPALFLLFLILLISNKPLIWISSIVLATLSIAFIVMDTQLYAISEFHLNSTILSSIFSTKMLGFFDFSNQEIMQIIMYFALITFFEILLAYVIWNQLILARRFILIGQYLFLLSVSGFVFCYASLLGTTLKGSALLSQQSVNLPYYDHIYSLVVHIDRMPYHGALDLGQDAFATMMGKIRPMNYPLRPLQCATPQKPYNIIFIWVDTLRSDMLNPQFMPKTYAFSEKNWVFGNHNSGGNSTSSGVTALLYSIPGTYFSSLMSQNISPDFYELLKNNNYKTKFMYSATLRDTSIFGSGVNGYSVEDSEHLSDVSDRDRLITQKAITFLNENKDGNRPLFLTLLYDSVHGFCKKQNIPQVYGVSNEGDCSRISLSSNDDPKPFYNRYLNTVKFVDGEIANLLDVIEKNDYFKNSIIVITADHGQQFNETKLNAWWHGTNFTHYQIQVPLIIHWPDAKPRQFNYATTSYDLMPTLFENVFGCKNPVSDYSIGQNLLKEKGRLPFELVAGYFNMGIIEKDKIISMTVSGQEVITRITDKEGYLLPNAKPDEEVVKKALLLLTSQYIAH